MAEASNGSAVVYGMSQDKNTPGWCLRVSYSTQVNVKTITTYVWPPGLIRPPQWQHVIHLIALSAILNSPLRISPRYLYRPLVSLSPALSYKSGEHALIFERGRRGNKRAARTVGDASCRVIASFTLICSIFVTESGGADNIASRQFKRDAEKGKVKRVEIEVVMGALFSTVHGLFQPSLGDPRQIGLTKQTCSHPQQRPLPLYRARG